MEQRDGSKQISALQLETTAYSELGEERTITLPAENLRYQYYLRAQNKPDLDAYLGYWNSRKNVEWVKYPGRFEFVKQFKKKIYTDLITDILMDLEPQSTFNPAQLWSDIKKKEQEEQSSKAGGKSKSKVEKLNQKDKMRLVNTLIGNMKELLREITKIRNSKSDLISINRSITLPNARIIMLMEMLGLALASYEAGVINNTDTMQYRKVIYEILWTLEGMDQALIRQSIAFPPSEVKRVVVSLLPADIQKDKPFLDQFMKDTWRSLKEEVASDKTLEVIGKGTNLICDSAAQIEETLKRAKDLMAAERDLIRLQLTEMSDSLPPLSRFNFGHSLDEWQKQVLSWVDEKKSVVISAPTSSGKTVLSTYVAVIFKSDAAKAAAAAAITDAPAEKVLTPEEEAAEGGGSYIRDEADYASTGEDNEEDYEIITNPPSTLLDDLAAQDRRMRYDYLRKRADVLRRKEMNERVLFVVPTEPLVWQVAAYFTKLLREEGDRKTKVALITDQIRYNPNRVLNIIPQIVVGTPRALESAMTKPLGLNGQFEASKIGAGDSLPGGFENYDWVIYDEVHALDGEEGAALQRIIRSMHCPFLALSATVGNADQLRAWFEQVRQDQLPTVQTLTIPTVESIIHQTRFINLQRYSWDQEAAPGAKLKAINPLTAVPSVESLRDGIMQNSSLSFTSKDCMRVWDAMSEVFPADAIDALSPHQFFGKQERITLMRSKEYEDMLKTNFPTLARTHPNEMQLLLDRFKIIEPAKEFSLCEMLLELKAAEMTPALPFHLNTFEAIRIFQQVLGELEWMQHATFPSYYTDLKADREARATAAANAIRSLGGNAKNLQQQQQSGAIQAVSIPEVDIYEPHPKFILSTSIPLNKDEIRKLVDEIERYDGFKKREKTAMDNMKGENMQILEHPLIRGLKRGIGLFVDEISFPSYRRAVQRLASEGKLGVVVSDSSLAFGVNMPFRTCIFCGEMNGQLDELMAQQMSGRAGRRGLDTQGNIIYAGIRMNLMRKLMIGKISNITGDQSSPTYDSLVLQPILAPRHVGYARAKVIGGVTLNDFIHGQRTADHLRTSQHTMTHLQFITAARNTTNGNMKLIPNPLCCFTHSLLTMVWELRRYTHESMTIGMLFHSIITEFAPIVQHFTINDRKLKVDAMETHLHTFFAIMTQLVCRTAWRPRRDLKADPRKMKDISYFSIESRQALLLQWEQRFALQQGYTTATAASTGSKAVSVEMKLTEDYYHLRDPVPPGTELDGTFLECCLDAKFVHNLDDHHKQEMKSLVWHMGGILKIMFDCTKFNDTYNRVAYFVFLNSFQKMLYLMAELVVAVIDFPDATAEGNERRRSAAAAAAANTSSATGGITRWDDMNIKQTCEEILRRKRERLLTVEDRVASKEAEAWSDLKTDAWHRAVESTLSICTVTSTAEEVWEAAFVYRTLRKDDVPFLLALLQPFQVDNKEYLKSLAMAMGSVSFGTQAFGSVAKVGVLIWFTSVVQPQAKAVFTTLLKGMLECGAVHIDDIFEFDILASLEAALPLLPSTYRTYRVKNFYEEKIGGVADSPVTNEDFATCKAMLASFKASFSSVCVSVIGSGVKTEAEISSLIANTVVQERDVPLLLTATQPFADEAIPAIISALQNLSFIQAFATEQQRGVALLGSLLWYLTMLQPTAQESMFKVLKALLADGVVTDEILTSITVVSPGELLQYLPSAYRTARVRSKVTTAAVDLLSDSEQPINASHGEILQNTTKKVIAPWAVSFMLAKESGFAGEELKDLIQNHTMLSDGDFKLLSLLRGYSAKAIPAVAAALKDTSYVQAFPEGDQGKAVLGLLTWMVTTKVLPSTALASLSLFLRQLYESDVVDEESMVTWHLLSLTEMLIFLPSSYSRRKVGAGQPLVTEVGSVVSMAQIAEVKTHAKPMIEWLQNAEEEEEDEEEDGEDEEED